MRQFILTVTNDNADYDLYFDIFNTSIADKWKTEVEQNYELFEIDRFSNWPNSKKDKLYYISELQKQIDIVNADNVGLIPVTLSNIENQDTMNYLHKFFENLRGPIDSPTEWYQQSSNSIQNAITRFNIMIHEYEHLCFSESISAVTNHPYATIVGTFNSRPRILLDDKDYDHYTYRWRFGTVYINYCEVGKPLMDVFKDQDEVIGDANIRPQHYYSADFQIKFGPDTLDEIYDEKTIQFWNWFNSKKEYFDTLGLVKSKKLALGMIPVASINVQDSNLENLSQIEIIEKLSQYQKIKKTCIK